MKYHKVKYSNHEKIFLTLHDDRRQSGDNIQFYRAAATIGSLAYAIVTTIRMLLFSYAINWIEPQKSVHGTDCNVNAISSESRMLYCTLLY